MSDTLKPGSADAVSALRRMGMEVFMITGDNKEAEGAMAFSSIFVVTNSLRLRRFDVKTTAVQKTLVQQLMGLLPRIVLPAVTLALVIILPFWMMPQMHHGSMIPMVNMVMIVVQGIILMALLAVAGFFVILSVKRKKIRVPLPLVYGSIFIVVVGTAQLFYIIGHWSSLHWWQVMAGSIFAVVSVLTVVALWRRWII